MCFDLRPTKLQGYAEKGPQFEISSERLLVIFPGDRYFCFSFWVTLTLSVMVIKTSYCMKGMIYQRESLNCFK